MYKFGLNHEKEVTNENSITQETFNENTTRPKILSILCDFINPIRIKKGFENLLIVLSGHGEPGKGRGRFQINERHGKRLFVKDLKLIVDMRRRTDEGKKK